MRKQQLTAMIVMALLSLPLLAQGRGPGRARGTNVQAESCLALAAIPAETLNPAEVDSLVYMREEEKLARDVYRGLFQKWGSEPFARIAAGEQRHMDAVAALLGRYDLPDPVSDNTPGVFKNATLHALYTDLMAQGSASLAAAFRVGATIEDLDIHDLDEALQQADNQDIKFVFDNLTRGSNNHLRAFSRQLESLGETYTAQYISPAELESILSSEMERGMGAGRSGCGFGRGM